MYVVLQINQMQDYAIKPAVYGPFSDYHEAQVAVNDLRLIESGPYLVVQAKHINRNMQNNIEKKKRQIQIIRQQKIDAMRNKMSH